jgi:hypothetical protein
MTQPVASNDVAAAIPMTVLIFFDVVMSQFIAGNVPQGISFIS